MNHDWTDDAACKGKDINIFYPPRPEGAGSASRAFEAANKRAKLICRPCKVRLDCLEYALTFPQSKDFGIWGGTTPEERKRIKRRRRERRRAAS